MLFWDCLQGIQPTVISLWHCGHENPYPSVEMQLCVQKNAKTVLTTPNIADHLLACRLFVSSPKLKDRPQWCSYCKHIFSNNAYQQMALLCHSQPHKYHKLGSSSCILSHNLDIISCTVMKGAIIQLSWFLICSLKHWTSPNCTLWSFKIRFFFIMVVRW